MKLEFSGDAFDTFERVINILADADPDQGYTVRLTFFSGAPQLDVELKGFEHDERRNLDVLRVRTFDEQLQAPRGDVYGIDLDDVDVMYVY